MSRELALRLARDGLVERWQIENALQAQLIYEGTLLSNLLRLGYLEEGKVLNYLGKQNQIPLVREERLAEISTRIIDMVPRDLVASYRFLPLGMQSEMLVVAVNAPLAPEVGAFISDFLSVKIKQVLAYEHLLLSAILRHFAMRLPSLIKRDRPMIDFSDPRQAGDDLTADSQNLAVFSSSPSISLLNSTLPGTMAGPPPGSTSVPMEEERPDGSLKILEAALTQADSRDEIIQAGCAWLTGYGVTAAFLTLKKSRLEGFHMAADEPRLAALKAFAWELEGAEDDLSGAVRNGEARVLATPTPKPWAEALAAALGHGETAACCVIPLVLKTKTLGLWVGYGPRSAALSVTTLGSAKNLLSAALETLILSQKIGV